MDTGRWIVITSDERFSAMWHTQQLYADYLSAHYNVIYVNPPRTWKPLNLVTFNRHQFVMLKKNIQLYDYVNIFPSFLRAFARANDRFNEQRIYRKLRKEKCESLLLWHFDSYRGFFRKYKDSFFQRIYHVIDPFFNNPIDRDLCRHSNLVILTSPRFQPYYKDFEKKLMVVPQAINLDANRLLATSTLINTNSKWLVLLGTFSNDIDYEWLQQIVDDTGFSLKLIGRSISEEPSVSKLKQLIQHPKVEYHAEMDPAGFYPHLKSAVAGLIVYSEARRRRICSPLKSLNYLVAGIPVISNIETEISGLKGCAIHEAVTAAQFFESLNLLEKKELRFDEQKVEEYLHGSKIEESVKGILLKLDLLQQEKQHGS